MIAPDRQRAERLMSQQNLHGSPPELDARVSQADIPHVYDRIAGVYDIWGRLTESRATARALELAAIEDGQSILEVAVGTGVVFREILRKNPHGQNLGIDLSPGMLARARSRMRAVSEGNYRLEAGTAFDLPVPSGSIDMLFNSYMFDLIPLADMDRVLEEFRRVLRPGGRLVLVNMAPGETRASRIYEAIYNLSPRALGGCRGVRMADRLQKHHFIVDAREYHQQMLFPSEVVLARKSA
jgi:demethylmenaquinone methyltransferase / 2-methoxy-6-polyprenyl-1,4-benzoquinol methylase